MMSPFGGLAQLLGSGNYVLVPLNGNRVSQLFPGEYENVLDNGTPGTQFIANVDYTPAVWSTNPASPVYGKQPDNYASVVLFD